MVVAAPVVFSYCSVPFSALSVPFRVVSLQVGGRPSEPRARAALPWTPGRRRRRWRRAQCWCALAALSFNFLVFSLPFLVASRVFIAFLVASLPLLVFCTAFPCASSLPFTAAFPCVFTAFPGSRAATGLRLGPTSDDEPLAEAVDGPLTVLFTVLSLSFHCLFTAFHCPVLGPLTVLSLPIHWLFTAYSLSCRRSSHCPLTAFSLPAHCLSSSFHCFLLPFQRGSAAMQVGRVGGEAFVRKGETARKGFLGSL